MAEGFKIATAYISILPDDTGFAEELKSKVDEAAAGVEAKVKVTLDDSELDAQVDDAKAKIEDLGAQTAKPKADLDDEDLSAKIDDAKAKVDDLDGKTAKPKVDLDDDGVDEKVQDTKAKLGGLDGEKASPEVDLDDAAAKAKIAELQAELQRLQLARQGIVLDADASPADVKVAQLQAKIVALNAAKAKPSADLDDAAAKAKIAELQAQLARLQLVKQGIYVPADTSEAEMKIASLQAQIEALKEEGKSVDIGGGEGGLSDFPTMLAGLGGGLAALSPGIGGATVGLGLLGGAGAMAFGGIAKALEAQHSASQNVGTTSAQLASTEFSNSVQIQQAQQSIGEAHQQAAQDATQSAEAIESSQMNLASVERNAASSQIQALQQVTQAQQGVEEANYGVSQAQYNLNQAWVTAQQDLQNLNDQLADSKLNVQSASLAIQQAIVNQQQVNENAYSTDLDRQQAALAVAQAQQQLTDAQAAQTDAQTAANTANQQGVSGSQTVIQAQQALTQAQYAQTNAVAELKDAQTNLTDTELNNAQQVKEAQLAVSQAQEQAAYSQKQDLQAITNAQVNLTNTIKEQQLQAAATASTSNQAANQFAADMKKLTPGAQGLVNQILGMSGALKKMEGAAQDAASPGLTLWLQGIQKLLPIVDSGISQMAGAMGKAFGQFGKLMETKSFAKTLQGLISNGIQFANIVLPAFAQFIGSLAKAGAQKGAVSGLANLLAGLANGLTNLVKGISPFIGPIGSFFTTLGSALSDIGAPLGTVIGSLVSGLAPALKDLLPGFKTLVDALGKGLSTALIGMAPYMGQLATAISQIVIAVAPLLPSIGTLIGQFYTGLLPALVAVTPLLTQIAQMLTQNLQQGILQMIQALIPLLPQLTTLVIELTPLVSLGLKVAGAVMKMADAMSVSFIQAIVGVAKPIAGAVSDLVTLASNWTALKETVKLVTGGVLTIVTGFVGDVGKEWAKLEPLFKAPVNFLISTVYDDGIVKLWNDVVGAIGLGSIKLPTIPALATGGVVPGWSPGRDNHLAAVSGGEGILTPQATQAVGGKDTIDHLNSQYPNNSPAPSKGEFGKELGKQARKHTIERPVEHLATAGMFSEGGIVGALTGAVSSGLSLAGSLLSGGIDLGKMVAAVATGNTTAFVNAASQMIGTSAAGDLGKIMTGIPKTLITDLAAKLTGTKNGTGASSDAIGSLPANYQTIASYLASHGFSKYAAAGVAGNIEAESGGNPEQLEIGGGGGGGLIQWTPYPASYITGNAAKDLQTQLAAITTWSGGPALVNTGTSPSNAAAIYQDQYERPANLTASLPQRMASANAVYKDMGWGSFDQGGWMPPGPPNFTGRPEAVLTPDESVMFKNAMTALAAGGSVMPGTGVGGVSTGAARGPVNVNFFGTQYPNNEQMAAIKRELALAIGGAT